MKKKKSPEFVLSEQEKEFLRSYREHPEFQEAVKILLDVADNDGADRNLRDISKSQNTAQSHERKSIFE